MRFRIQIVIHSLAYKYFKRARPIYTRARIKKSLALRIIFKAHHYAVCRFARILTISYFACVRKIRDDISPHRLREHNPYTIRTYINVIYIQHRIHRIHYRLMLTHFQI